MVSAEATAVINRLSPYRQATRYPKAGTASPTTLPKASIPPQNDSRTHPTAMNAVCTDPNVHEEMAVFLAHHFVPDPGQSKLTTMNKSQKKMFNEGTKQIEAQDAAMWSALSGRRPTTAAKLLFVIASCMMDKTAGLGQVSHFVDPGARAQNCTASMIEKLKADVDEYCPTVIYAQVSWDEDYQISPGHDNLIKFMSEQEEKGTTCIVADSRHCSLGRSSTNEVRRRSRVSV